jgi:DNA-binding FadR family transcriptional regulator
VEQISEDAAERLSEPSPVAALVSPEVAGITRLSATETVRARIALAIELGLMEPGEQLPSDAQIAKALDVSEITARRALKSLADEGVLARRRGRNGGTFVHETARAALVDAVTAYRADTAEVHALIDQRVLLECALAHHAALAITPHQLLELKSYVEDAAAAKNWADYHAADEKLHLGIAHASGLDWALPHYSRVFYALYNYFLPYPVTYLRRVNQEHVELLSALERHDPVAAVAILREHLLTLHSSMFVGLGKKD